MANIYISTKTSVEGTLLNHKPQTEMQSFFGKRNKKTGGLYWNDPKTEKENTYYGKKFIYWRKYQRVSK